MGLIGAMYSDPGVGVPGNQNIGLNCAHSPHSTTEKAVGGIVVAAAVTIVDDGST